MFDYFDEVLKDIGDLMNIDFAKRVRTLALGPKAMSLTPHF